MTPSAIPPIIHYCWFGRGPKSQLMEQCIASWQKQMPRYEIKEWNEENFDVNITTYTAEAYRLKAYAFVTDFARFWILYHHGGIYFDTDVELLHPIDDLVSQGAFMGFEAQPIIPYRETGIVNPGLGIAFPAGHPFCKRMIDFYSSIHFVRKNGKHTGNTVLFTTSQLDWEAAKKQPDGKVELNQLTLYPESYFCPYNCYTHEAIVTEETRSIHHYTASWVDRNLNRSHILVKRLRYLYVRISMSIKQFLHKQLLYRKRLSKR